MGKVVGKKKKTKTKTKQKFKVHSTILRYYLGGGNQHGHEKFV